MAGSAENGAKSAEEAGGAGRAARQAPGAGMRPRQRVNSHRSGSRSRGSAVPSPHFKVLFGSL